MTVQFINEVPNELIGPPCQYRIEQLYRDMDRQDYWLDSFTVLVWNLSEAMFEAAEEACIVTDDEPWLTLSSQTISIA